MDRESTLLHLVAEMIMMMIISEESVNLKHLFMQKEALRLMNPNDLEQIRQQNNNSENPTKVWVIEKRKRISMVEAYPHHRALTEILWDLPWLEQT
jgi:hypothetical protein